MRVKAIIFDWDGVIVDSLPANLEIYEVIEKKLDKKIFADNANGDDFELDWREHFIRVNIKDEKTHKRAAAIYHEELKKLEKDIKLFPGIEKVINVLNKNYKLGIVSNTNSEAIERKMNELGIKKYFNVIIGGEFSTLKPNPGQVIECMRRLGVRAEETIYIGDMDGDVTTGRNAGVKMVVAVTYGFHSEKKFKNLNPDIILNAPEELMELAKY